jgi:hypothetical protein
MKSRNYINNLLLVLLFISIAVPVFPQKSKKVEMYCEDIRFRFRCSECFELSSGKLIISDDAHFGISSKIIVLRNSESKPSKVSVILIGKDLKGTKWVEEVELKLNEKTDLYDATFSIKASKENPFFIGEVSCSIIDSNNETSTQTESFSSTDKKPSFAILLNGYERPAQYGQCWVFSKGTTDNSNFVNLGDLNVTQTISEDKETKMAIFDIELSFNSEKEKNAELLGSILTWGEATSSVNVILEYENGKRENVKFTIKFWPERTYPSYDHRFSGRQYKRARIKNITLEFINTCNDKFTLNTVYQSGYLEDKTSWTETWLIDQKTNDKDPCDTKYKLKDIEYTETNVSGLYGLQFSFQLEDKSDVPYAVRMIVQLTDCKGNKQNIEITLKYNDKTRTYSGGQTISQSKECPWELTYGEIAAYNECKDKTVWSFDPSKAKGNGSGTKNATTTTSAKPQLL